MLTFLRDLDHASTMVLAIRQLQHKREPLLVKPNSGTVLCMLASCLLAGP